MSSRAKPPSRRTPTLVLALFALASLLAGCGKKGAPMPPPSKLPQPVNDLKAERWGDTVRLEFTYPTVTVGGLPLSGIKAVEVWEVVRPFMAQPTALPATTGTTGTQPIAGAETGTAPGGSTEEGTHEEGHHHGSTTEDGAPSPKEPATQEPAESTSPEAEQPPATAGQPNGTTGSSEGTSSSQSTTSSQTGSSEQNTSGEQTTATGTSGETSTTGMTTTEGTAAPVSVAPPQPTISSLDFKSSSKQLTTIEGDQLKSAIMGGKILLEIPASSLHTLPPPPPPEEGAGGTAPTSTESSTPAEAVAPSGTETATPATAQPAETTEPAATAAPESAGERPTNEQPSASTAEQAPASTTQPSTATTESPAGASGAATAAMPKPTLEEVHFLAVRTISEQGKTSDFSRIAYLVAGTPPPPPTGLTATTSEGGVQLAWTLPTLPEGSKLEGVQVYRRSQDESVFETPLTMLAADATEYTDASAQFGQQYTYAVGAVGRTRPLLQSALSDTTSLLYEDIYQPAPPARLDLFPEAQRVRLIWEASTSPDVVGYRVERAGADGRFEILTSVLLTTPEYIDHDVEHGATYSYRIVALDDAGNASEPSPTETARIP